MSSRSCIVQPSAKKSLFTLGTAQLGMKYGIANISGKPTDDEADSIIKNAINQGVFSIDTARNYGNAETLIGRALKEIGLTHKIQITTKLSTLQDADKSLDKDEVAQYVEKSIFDSLEALQTDCLQTLLLHRWQHRFDYNERIWQKLIQLKKQGYIENLGASIYSPQEAIEALHEPEITHIQLPFNILDWRWQAKDVPDLVLSRNNVQIDARSSLLQGLLSSEAKVWLKAGISSEEATKWVTRLDTLVRELKRENKVDLCFAYVRSQPWITNVVIGIETFQQLELNVKLFNNPPLSVDECKIVETFLVGAKEELLNPSKWNSKMT